MSGEFDLIAWIRSQHRASDFVPVPQGDDLAVLRWNAADLLLVGVDQVLDGVHFDSSSHTPRQIGAKVMNRNLSDCAAMACLPAAAVTTAALPFGVGIDYARELYLGMRKAGDVFGCELVGGDTGSWEGKLAMTVTILGRSAGIRPITRSGARPGDGLYITGALGGSILGRHLSFTPRITLARDLARSGLVAAMLDVSDGLSRDVRHLCSGNLGVTIDASSIPIHEDAVALSRADLIPPLEHALHDGEDHELLFAASENPGLPGVTRIGVFSNRPGVHIVMDGAERDLEPRGWEHKL